MRLYEKIGFFTNKVDRRGIWGKYGLTKRELSSLLIARETNLSSIKDPTGDK